MANLIPMIAEKLGVELRERFKITKSGTVGLKIEGIYCFEEGYLKNAKRLLDNTDDILIGLCKGYYEVIHLRFKPAYGQTFYYVTRDGDVIDAIWADTTFDLVLYQIGNCFKNAALAHENKPNIIKHFKEVRDND